MLQRMLVTFFQVVNISFQSVVLLKRHVLPVEQKLLSYADKTIIVRP